MNDLPAATTDMELQTQILQYRACLFDPETQLPSLPAVLDEVRRLLGEQGAVQVLLIRIEQEQSLESVVGWERYDTLLRHVANYLREALSVSHGADSILCQMRVRCDRFLIFLADRRQSSRLLELLSEPIEIKPEDGEGDALTVGVRVGHGDIRLRPALRIERCIYAGIAEAATDFNRRGEELDLSRLRELHSILHERRVSTVFQPIVRLPQRTVVGYEALSRGPEGSYLQPAERLLGFAERSGLLGELEMLCVEKALAASHRLPLGSTVFLNLSYHGLEYLERESKGLAHLVRQAGWSPRECVLEITEHTYAEDPERIKQRILRLRQQGFRVAIDDMGTGFSSLNTLAELRPDYIKLDHMLVRGVAKEPIKRNLISAITGFARTSQALVIAEGVEHEEEISALLDLG
ncbi:MAG TPA: EAL domain-containing protein, partial [Acidobacteria bacterium]|nr:EAL domain-containing protein [Acidobacteriota bacterium]